MNETAGITSITTHVRNFLSMDLFTLGLVTVFIVTIAVLWARGPLENILRE